MAFSTGYGNAGNSGIAGANIAKTLGLAPASSSGYTQEQLDGLENRASTLVAQAVRYRGQKDYENAVFFRNRAIEAYKQLKEMYESMPNTEDDLELVKEKLESLERTKMNKYSGGKRRGKNTRRNHKRSKKTRRRRA